MKQILFDFPNELSEIAVSVHRIIIIILNLYLGIDEVTNTILPTGNRKLYAFSIWHFHEWKVSNFNIIRYVVGIVCTHTFHEFTSLWKSENHCRCHCHCHCCCCCCCCIIGGDDELSNVHHIWILSKFSGIKMQPKPINYAIYQQICKHW